MADGLPLRLFHQGYQGNGNIGQHEEGEGKHVFDLLAFGGMNIVPFGECGQHAQDKHEQAVVEQAEEHRRKRTGDHGACRHIAECGKNHDNAVKANGNNREQHSGRNGHEHVVTGKLSTFGVGENTFDQTRGIMPKHLVEAFRPAEPLVPGIPEGDGLFVVEHGGGAVGDAAAIDDSLGGEFDIFGEQVPFPAAMARQVSRAAMKKPVPETAQAVLSVRRAWLRYFASRKNQMA